MQQEKENYEMSKEQTTEKVLVFNPGGVILKVLFSIGFIVLALPVVSDVRKTILYLKHVA